MNKQELVKSISILKAAEKSLSDSKLDGKKVGMGTTEEHFEYSALSKKLSAIRYELELSLNDCEASEIFYSE